MSTIAPINMDDYRYSKDDHLDLPYLWDEKQRYGANPWKEPNILFNEIGKKKSSGLSRR